MIHIYARNSEGRLELAAHLAVNDPRAIWIDLENPSEQEESQVEGALAIDVPTHNERAAYEESARFYEENGAAVMTATLLGRRDDGPFVSDAVMFVLTASKLVTVRKIRPRSFQIGEGRATARIECAENGADVMVALIESAIERIADRTAEANAEANALSAEIFAEGDAAPNLRASMRTLGRVGALAAQSLDSLASLQRLLSYAISIADRHGLDKARLTQLRSDAAELERTTTAFQDRLVFLLDAAVGLVSVSQNEILKALSVATIAFVPPTLIASIFGMNFEHMTWFREWWGPWVGFSLMAIAPSALFWIAKWRRWF